MPGPSDGFLINFELTTAIVKPPLRCPRRLSQVASGGSAAGDGANVSHSVPPGHVAGSACRGRGVCQVDR